jgi:hypothetical protein
MVEPVGAILICSSEPLTGRLLFYSQIFPNYLSAQRPVAKNSVLAKIKEKRVLKKSAVAN